MLFNTAEYFIFFVIVLTVSWLVAAHRQVRLWFLLAASLYFYTSNNHWQVLLLLLTTTIDYLLCIWLSQIEGRALRKVLLAVSVCSNLGLLAYFKYFNFFGQSVASLSGLIGLRLDWVDLNVALPVGISFYTFEALSYTIDVYRGKIPAQRQWNRLAFLVSFFPHLIAGPIVRAADFFPQMDRRPWLSRREFELALYLIVAGLVKKIVFADTLSYYADAAFDGNSKIGAYTAWVGVYAFAFQIYFDFSGYTDIALGSAKLLGFQLPENFNYPYAASSITDFWSPLAHQSFNLASRLCLYLIGRQPHADAVGRLPKPHADDVAWRRLAWGGVPLHHLGRFAWFPAVVRARLDGRHPPEFRSTTQDEDPPQHMGIPANRVFVDPLSRQ